MSKEDGARAAWQMKWLLLVMLQKRHANWHELTDDEQRALFDKAFEETMDGMVADGIFSVRRRYLMRPQRSTGSPRRAAAHRSG